MKAKVPSGFWVYSPTRSAAVVSPSPATVMRSSPKAASISEVFPVPGGPSSRAGTESARSLRRTSTSGIPASARGW